MSKRFIIGSTFLAVAAGLVVPTAHATGTQCPIWMCGGNGTQLHGIAPQQTPVAGIAAKRTEIQLPKPSTPEPIFGCPIWECGGNGTQLNGAALQGAPLGSRDARLTEIVFDRRMALPR